MFELPEAVETPGEGMGTVTGVTGRNTETRKQTRMSTGRGGEGSIALPESVKTQTSGKGTANLITMPSEKDMGIVLEEGNEDNQNNNENEDDDIMVGQITAGNE